MRGEPAPARASSTRPAAATRAVGVEVAGPSRARRKSSISALPGPVSKASSAPGASGPRRARVDPGDVADAAEVEEGERRRRPRSSARRRSGRTAPAARPRRRCAHVGGAEVPDHRQPQRLAPARSPRPTWSVPRPRGSCARVWPWKPDELDALEARHRLGVRRSHHAPRPPRPRRSPGQRPSAARSDRPLRRRIGAEGARPEAQDASRRRCRAPPRPPRPSRSPTSAPAPASACHRPSAPAAPPL